MEWQARQLCTAYLVTIAICVHLCTSDVYTFIYSQLSLTKAALVFLQRRGWRRGSVKAIAPWTLDSECIQLQSEKDSFIVTLMLLDG